MSIEAMKQALEALANSRDYIYLSPTGDCTWSEHEQLSELKQAITALRQAIEQAEKQEPVAYRSYGAMKNGLTGWRFATHKSTYHDDPKQEPLYTSPPPRQPEQAEKQEPVAWATKEDFYRELDRLVERTRKEMEIKSVTMRCKDYDLALPIIDTRFGRVLVGQMSTPQRQPLTDQKIYFIWRKHIDPDAVRYTPYEDDGLGFARAIEAAHGIGEQNV